MKYLAPAFFWISLYACAATTAAFEFNHNKPIEVFIGDSQKQAVVRKQSNTVLSCNDPKFDEMVCMSMVDFQSIADELKYLRDKNQ